MVIGFSITNKNSFKQIFFYGCLKSQAKISWLNYTIPFFSINIFKFTSPFAKVSKCTVYMLSQILYFKSVDVGKTSAIIVVYAQPI